MDSDTAGALEAVALLGGMGVALASMGFWLWALIDAAVRDSGQWQRAGHNKAVWLAILVGGAFLGCLAFAWVGALLYLLIPRAAMRRLRTSPPAWGPS